MLQKRSFLTTYPGVRSEYPYRSTDVCFACIIGIRETKVAFLRCANSGSADWPFSAQIIEFAAERKSDQVGSRGVPHLQTNNQLI